MLNIKNRYRSLGIFWILWIFSWIIVAFGQPSRSFFFSFLASTCGYAFFWIALRSVIEKRRRFWHGVLWFTCVQAIQLSWMTATAYHGFYIIIVYLVVLIWFGLQFGILTVFLPICLQSSVFGSCAISGLWVLMEWSRLFVFCGFPFNMSGMALGGNVIAAQWAAVGGVFGLSFLVILINIIGFKALHNRARRSTWIYFGLIASVYTCGSIHLGYHQYQMQKESSLYHVALVQTGLKPEEKIPLGEKTAHFVSPFDQWWHILLYLKKHRQNQFDLIVLPEAALPYGAHQEIYPIEDVRWIIQEVWGEKSEQYFPLLGAGKKYVSNIFWAQTIANYYQSELIIGLDDYDAQVKESYNAAFHLFPQKSSEERYEKCILVPLAEYLPIKFLKPLVMKYGIFDFTTHGTHAKVFGTNVPTAISVCYEECFGHFIRKGRVKGAQLLVNVTNDGWYLPSKLPEQHFYHGRLRSIENGVPLVRACNTGITAGVDSLGNIHGQLEKEQDGKIVKGVLLSSIPLYHYPTLYTLWGDSAIIAFSVFSLVGFAYSKKFLSVDSKKPSTLGLG